MLAGQHLKLANRTRQGCVLVFADLDGLKQINDRFGHAEGDVALRRLADALRAKIERKKADPLALDFPKVADGVRGMQFIDAVVKSSAKGARWVKV